MAQARLNRITLLHGHKARTQRKSHRRRFYSPINCAKKHTFDWRVDIVFNGCKCTFTRQFFNESRAMDATAEPPCDIIASVGVPCFWCQLCAQKRFLYPWPRVRDVYPSKIPIGASEEGEGKVFPMCRNEYLGAYQRSKSTVQRAS